ncbi:MAG: ATP-binding protein, partial [Candidatus Eisenbacteria bacterium]|nr:ATP-binding protein [Candidatus Eisenbacteria bacterium]
SAGFPRDLAILPVGSAQRRRAALFFRASPRAALWRHDPAVWETLACAIDSGFRADRERRARDAQERFEEVLLKALPLGVLTLDPLGRVSSISDHAAEILGWPAAEARGADCLRVFRPAGVEENPLLLGLAGKATRVDLYITDREGKEKPVWVQMARLPGSGSRSRGGLLVLIRDTTEERAFEEDQRRRERLASIGELSAGVAHEIRNPLTGIGNCAQVLQDRIAADDPLRKFVQIILDEAARLNRIVESLLSFARPGRPQLRQAAIVDVLRHVLDLERDACEEQGISTELKIRGRIPPIWIDPEQITQVVLNVVRNAGEAMPAGGHLGVECLVVRRRPHARRGTGQRSTDRIRYGGDSPMRRFVQVRVSDTGGGIPKETLPRIFDPFFTTRKKGTGLGLSISQSILKEHGGFISIRSIESKGTTVIIDLPIERREGERRKPSS